MSLRTSNRWTANLPGSWDALNFEHVFPSSNRWGIPKLREAFFDSRGIEAVGYHESKRDPTNALCHFFLDDYRFERVFHRKRQALERILRFRHVLSPDFSTWRNMPPAMQLWNVYRSRWCAAYWQSHGVSIGVTGQWSDESSWEFCFEGIPKGCLLAVTIPNLGIRRSRNDEDVWENAKHFRAGLAEAFWRLEPRGLLAFGKPTDEPSDFLTVGMMDSLEFLDLRLQSVYRIGLHSVKPVQLAIPLWQRDERLSAVA